MILRGGKACHYSLVEALRFFSEALAGSGTLLAVT